MFVRLVNSITFSVLIVISMFSVVNLASQKALARDNISNSKIKVLFRLDPRLTRGQYMGDLWVSPADFTAVGNEKECYIEAKAQVFNAKGEPTDISPEWISQDTGMVFVSPTQGRQVKVTVLKPGESKLKLVLNEFSKELFIKAEYVSGIIHAHISQ